ANAIETSGFLAPVVLSDKCVGCGLCQTRCHMIHVKQKHLLGRTAIEILAGDGREDRLRSGSYIALRQRRQYERSQIKPPQTQSGNGYLPDFLK
ncbi:MAG: 4Fe-4S ferredoxin, partial [Planctomycetota bacterium]|nr:4Fe-4S ferredoxin [Planctomycetota bacterium]